MTTHIGKSIIVLALILAFAVDVAVAQVDMPTAAPMPPELAVLVKALRDFTAIGPLKLKDMGDDATIDVIGVHNIDGDLLPLVSIRYPRDPSVRGKATAELGPLKGSIR